MSVCDHGYLEAHQVPGDLDETCPGPVVNIALRVVDPHRPGHVEVDVFVGRKHTGRGRAGRIMLRRDEWEELRDRLLVGDPIEMGLTT